MKKILFLLLFCSTIFSLGAQTGHRPLIFVHGLSGNGYSWDRAMEAVRFGATSFPARKAETTFVTYSQNAIQAAANTMQVDVKTRIAALDANNGFPYSQNIIIAHSQGGVVSRKLDQMIGTGLLHSSERRFGGIITFGTPHGGAKLLDNAYAGYHTTFINDACNSIIAGPVAEKTTGVIFRWFGVQKLAQDVSTQVCNATTLGVAKFFGSEFLQPITADYQVSSPSIQALNTYAHPQIAKIAAFGVEHSPEFWRTALFLTLGNPNNFAPFSADNDNQLVDDANTNRQVSLDKYNYWVGKVNSCFLNCNSRRTIRDGWFKTYKWWEQSNDKWKTFIGSNSVNSTFLGTCTMSDPWSGLYHDLQC